MRTRSLAVVVLCSSALLFNCRNRAEQGTTELAADGGSPESIFKISSEKIFDSDGLHELTFHMDGDSWTKMTNLPAQQGYSCIDGAPYAHVKEFYFKNYRTNEDRILHNVGMRIKGNTSCDDDVHQRGLKVKLNTTKVYEKFGTPLKFDGKLTDQIKNQNLFGIEEFAVRRGGTDVTHVRDLIASDVFEFAGDLQRKFKVPGAPKLGGPVFRGSLAKVKIHNGFSAISEDYAGLVEAVDADLIKSHYGKGTVDNLFKMHQQDRRGTFAKSDMPTNNQNYLFKIYEPKNVDGHDYDPNNKSDRDRAEQILFGFSNLLYQTLAIKDVKARAAKAREFLDVDNILSYMVSVNLTGHWDSLITSGNNDFIFNNKQTGKWGVLTWDLDNTFGAQGHGELWMRGIREFGVDLKYRPLFDLVMNTFYDDYRLRVKDYLEGIFGFDNFNGRITQFQKLMPQGTQQAEFDIIYKFYAHRFANAWCQVFKGENMYAAIVNGGPKIGDHGFGVECTDKR